MQVTGSLIQISLKLGYWFIFIAENPGQKYRPKSRHRTGPPGLILCPAPFSMCHLPVAGCFESEGDASRSREHVSLFMMREGGDEREREREREGGRGKRGRGRQRKNLPFT